MTIDEAIKELEDLLRYAEPGNPTEEDEAIQLGIEALKRVKAFSDMDIIGLYKPLPGETEDTERKVKL
jgi:hypothetical protein